MVVTEPTVGHLNQALGSSLIANPAYQEWPTQTKHRSAPKGTLADLKFESRTKGRKPPAPPIIALPDKTANGPAILRETSGETSY